MRTKETAAIFGVMAWCGLMMSVPIARAESEKKFDSWKIEDTSHVLKRKTAASLTGLPRSLPQWSFEAWFRFDKFSVQPCGTDSCSKQPAYCQETGTFIDLGEKSLTLKLDGYRGAVMIAANGVERSVLRPLKAATWTHLVLVQEAGKTHVKMYWDGTSAADLSGMKPGLTLGSPRAVSGDLDGKIDGLEIRGATLYGGSLSPEAVKNHFKERGF